ncbi:MAG: 1-acyl-sn-glycerol-3-phosphate acyltransferase [Firmicutes bacterium]|nr:1-acyl-sn-glycerol-3-phosphate acyltransferase [Bacillota bacterium]
MSEKTTKKVIKKPNPFLYYLASLIIAPYLKFMLHTTYDRSGIRDIETPSIVVCPHVSNIDFLLVAVALFPHRPTFVVSQHFMAKPKIRRILEIMHVIPKKMFCPDVKTILNIMRAKESGNIIVIFPEGRLSCFGHSLQVTDGTAELIKKLGISVYTICENGAYKTLPKWGKAGARPGRIEVTSAKLIDSADLADMTIDEINAVLDQAILHDEDAILTDVTYKCKAPALGLDGILYKCPECISEFETVSDDHSITCRRCGFSARLDEKYRLSGGPFERINDWFFWQESLIDLDTPLETDCLVGTTDSDGYMDMKAGQGHITMDRENIHFTGTCYGQPLEFTESTSIIKGFPASVGNHIDIYHKKQLYYIKPQPDSRVTIKWVSYLDKLTKERDK